MHTTLRIFASTIFLATAFGCQNNPRQKPIFLTHPEITQNFTSGSWHIETFKINGKQQRERYSDSHFSFTKQNLVSVRIGQETYIGDWWVESDTSSDDEPNVDLSFSMDFQREKSLKYLNGDWAILERSKNRLRLLSLDTDNLEYLTFEKDSLQN